MGGGPPPRPAGCTARVPALTAFVTRAARLQVEYPMLFRLENRRTGRGTHTGVLEFIAEEGILYVPYWVRISMKLFPR